MIATKVKKLTFLAIMTAVSLIMFLLEGLIPIPLPVPGVKLGLSNIISVCVLFLVGRSAAFAVLLLRVSLGALITGQLSGIIYSLCGGILSLAVLCLLRPILKNSQLWIAGALGGALHNVGQIAAAMVITQTPAIIVYLPVLLLCGMIAGLFTGLCAQFLYQRLQKIKLLEDIL